MSPSTNQQDSESEEYQTEADRMIAEKPERVLLSIKPMTEANAREWLGACNRHDVSDELQEHFVEQVRRLR